jgi:hypothetical protein
MRDPNLVQRAERAATALERAWIHWRTMHGLGSDPLPPVSSYVGYSLEEPWGQPRVVFGVGAEEAERLAAMLDGHDCVGPIHAEVRGRPEWRHGSGSGPGLPGRAFGEQLHIPAQAPQPLADMFPPGSYTDGPAAANGAAAHDGLTGADAPAKSTDATAAGSALADSPLADSASADGAPADSTPVDSAPVDSASIESAPADTALGDTALGDTALADTALGDASADSAQHDGTAEHPAGPLEPAAVADEADRLAPEVALGSGAEDDDDDVYLAEPLPDFAEQLAPLPPLEIVTFRQRPEELADGAEQAAPLAAAPIDTSGYDIMPNQGPGYRGPRYQGSPPQYQPGPSPDAAPSDYSAGPAEELDVPATSDQPHAGQPSSRQQARSKARQFPKRGRTRRQGPGAHEAWDSADERSATDHAV